MHREVPRSNRLTSRQSGYLYLDLAGYWTAEYFIHSTMKSTVPGLLKKFETRHRLVRSDITETQKEALAQLLQEGRVVHAGAYYLAGHEPTIETERGRLVQTLLSRPRLFKESSLKPKIKDSQRYFRSALSELIDQREVIQLAIVGDSKSACFIHREHLIKLVGNFKERESKQLESGSLVPESDKGRTAEIRQAYFRVAQEKERSSIFIWDLLKASGMSWDELRAWIEREIVEAGHGQLDEGDWGAATDEQRSAAVELSGRKRLYITLT